RMSQHFLKTALSIGLALAPVAAWGQSAPPGPPPVKVGVINIQAVIANTGEGKKALAALDKKYAPRRQDLQEQQQAVTAIQDQLQKQGTTLSDDEQRRLTRELQEKQTRLKRSQDDAQSDYSADTQDVVNRIGQKLVRIMNDYAQQNGYAVIIEGNPQLIYYAAPQSDLTEEMIKRYDAANPVAADAGGAVKPAATRSAAAKPADKPKP
ncbi:MAG TPA: OmpH family outer membrane protein, partial [Terriglobia bacterium]|nr:OmpH family outer membrane protein [Terriglobia bacterium]